MTKTFKEEAERIVINLYLGKTFTEIVPNWRAELKNPKIDAAIEALQHLHDAGVARMLSTLKQGHKAPYTSGNAEILVNAIDDLIASLQPVRKGH